MTILDVTGNSNSASDAGSGNRPPVAQRWPWLRVGASGETMTNRAFSGDMAQDQGYKARNLLRASTSTAVVICDINDARFVNLARIDRYKEFLNRIVADIVLPNKKTWASANVTKTGTWAGTQVDNTGMYANVAGAKGTATVDGTTVYVGYLVDNHTASQGATADVYIDSVYRGTIAGDNIGVNTGTGNTYNGLRWGLAVKRFPGLSAGTHTVEVVLTGTYAKNMHMSFIAGNVQPATAKTLVGNCYNLNATGVASFGVTSTISAAFKAASEQVVADFVSDGFNVKVLDTFGTIDPNSHLMVDGLHWNAAGHTAVKNLSLTL